MKASCLNGLSITYEVTINMCYAQNCRSKTEPEQGYKPRPTRVGRPLSHLCHKEGFDKCHLLLLKLQASRQTFSNVNSRSSYSSKFDKHRGVYEVTGCNKHKIHIFMGITTDSIRQSFPGTFSPTPALQTSKDLVSIS